MDRAMIREWAREADIDWHSMFAGDDEDNRLERFAALVAAHEREQCALVCDDLGARYWAKDDAIESLNCEECATAIRARGAPNDEKAPQPKPGGE